MEIAGAEVPSDMQGRSLVPVFQGNTPEDWRKTFYYHYYEYPGWHYVRRHFGVTDSRFKLIRFYEKDVDEWEMYDLRYDPYEMNNLYGHAAYQKVQARLARELERLRMEFGDAGDDPPSTVIKNPPERVRTPTG